MADNNADDLDQILDSALEDFSSLGLSSGGPCSLPSAAAPKGLGLGLGLPELGRGKKKGKKIEQNASAAAALEELRRQTREAVKGLESATAVPTKGGLDFDNDAMEDFIKQFEELGASQGKPKHYQHNLLAKEEAAKEWTWAKEENVTGAPG